MSIYTPCFVQSFVLPWPSTETTLWLNKREGPYFYTMMFNYCWPFFRVSMVSNFASVPLFLESSNYIFNGFCQWLPCYTCGYHCTKRSNCQWFPCFRVELSCTCKVLSNTIATNPGTVAGDEKITFKMLLNCKIIQLEKQFSSKMQ